MTEKSASDVLRELLEECGVEYEAYRDIKDRRVTKWRTYHGAFVFFAVEKEGKLFVETASDTEHSAICTPEQAIAATLGSDNEYEAKMDALLCRLTNGKRSKTRQYSLEFMDTCISEEFEALYSEEQFSASVSGTLTAEQVQEAVYKHSVNDGSVYSVFKGCFQAIADELNAELGSELNPDGLPVGLTISEDGELLNWRGENYVKQGTLWSERVQEKIDETDI